MRVKFRIVIHKDGKKLRKEDLLGEKEPFWVGVRYITEFRYLEATKWLMLAQDCYEKYLLLALTNLALGQESQAQEFYQEALSHKPCHALEIFLEMPEKGERVQVKEGCNLEELIYTYLHEKRQDQKGYREGSTQGSA